MTSISRMVFMNGTDRKCKILGFTENTIVVRGKHRKVYFNSDQVKFINYKPVEDFGFDSGLTGMEVSV